MKVLLAVILLISIRSHAEKILKCDPNGYGFYGAIDKIQDVPSGKIIFLHTDGHLGWEDKNLIVPIKISENPLIFSDLDETKRFNYTPKVNEQILLSIHEPDNCLYRARVKTFNDFQDAAHRTPEQTGKSKTPLCKIANKISYEKAVSVAIEREKSSTTLQRLLELEKDFIPHEICVEGPAFLYYRNLAHFNREASDPKGLSRLENLTIEPGLKNLLLTPEFCNTNPETRYQAFMQKETLDEIEQGRLLELERLLSTLIQREVDPPFCLKYKIWDINLKPIEARMHDYRTEVNGVDRIDWEKYKNPKIDPESHAFISQKMAKYLGDREDPMFIEVPGELSPAEGPSVDQKSLSEALIKICKTYNVESLRDDFRDRTLSMLDKMDTRLVQTSDDRTPTNAQRNRILNARKKIRKELTEVLNKNCKYTPSKI